MALRTCVNRQRPLGRQTSKQRSNRHLASRTRSGDRGVLRNREKSSLSSFLVPRFLLGVPGQLRVNSYAQEGRRDGRGIIAGAFVLAVEQNLQLIL